ncbi:MAG: helix-turn-helix transcriptional regulator [Clostridia bacterium]|nr:helix-turn-helix transcriptional regulator [Clostridia bacterium]
MTLGQRIQELRKQQGMSQEALGEALGVSRQAVSKWESDNGIPALDTLIAMSRLFGVTVGELLGVEEPHKNGTGDAADQGAQTEELLRRYAEQIRESSEPAPSPVLRGVLILAATATAVILIVLFAQIGSLRNTVKLLRTDLSHLQVNVSNNQNNLSAQIRNTIYDVLAEEAKLLNTFGWEVVDFDPGTQSVTLSITATMKEYAAGSSMQLCAQYTKTDGTHGQTVGDWVEGPDFCTRLNLPLNSSTEMTIRVRDEGGNIKEQVLDQQIYGLSPESFCLSAYNLTVPFAITAKGPGITTTTVRAEDEHIQIYSAHPEYVYPEKAVLIAYINDDLLIKETLNIAHSEKSDKIFNAALKDEYYSVTLKNGDKLSVRLTVTDNLGRVEEFFDSTEVKDGELLRTPIEVPAIPAD